MTHCLIIAPHAGEHYAVRWLPEHPLAVYVVLEHWLREGVLDVSEFNILIGQVCQQANVAKEAASG